VNSEHSENRAAGLSEQEYYYFRLLSEVEGIGAIKIKNLYNYFLTFQAVFSSPVSDLTHVEGISHELAGRIRKKERDDAELARKISHESKYSPNWAASALCCGMPNIRRSLNEFMTHR
jgi:ERCC4-type nuclease